MLLHVIEALVFTFSNAADGSIGMAALIRAVPNRSLLIGVMLVSAIMAGIVLARRRVSPLSSALLLAPQQALLFITAIAAWLAVWHGSYADGVLRSPLFITTDQLPRGIFSLMHLTAMYGIASYHQICRVGKGAR